MMSLLLRSETPPCSFYQMFGDLTLRDVGKMENDFIFNSKLLL